MSEFYWWSRYGKFVPGLHNLPHTGEVIVHYRKKLYRTQEEFRIAAGVTLRAVQEWESNIMTADMSRRIFLAKMLKIPPALLGLTWQSVIDEEHTPVYITAFGHITNLLQEHSYGLYEDLLALSYECYANGISTAMIYRFQQHHQELERLIEAVPELEKDAWRDLLCRFYQFSTFIIQRHTTSHDKNELALTHAKRAVSLALSLDDPELCGAAFYRRSRLYLTQDNSAAARQDIEGAMNCIEQVRGPLKGNTYLLAAEIHALQARADENLRIQCRSWQDKAATMLYRGNLEEDGSFLWFDLFAVHHERAKMLSRFALFHTSDEELLEQLKGTHAHADTTLLKDAQSALTIAWNTIEADASWEKTLYFSVTEARWFIIAREFEEGAKTARKVLHLARQGNSQEGMKQVRKLYVLLNGLAPTNPYVRNLGIELGIF